MPYMIFSSLSFLILLGVVTPCAAVPKESSWSFYSSGVMPDESVLFSADVEARTAKLLFKPTKVLSVKAANESMTYEAGKDYLVDLEKGTLSLPANSRIPCPKLYNGEGKNYGYFRNRKGEAMLTGKDDFFHDLQIKVAYEHSGTAWDGKPFVPKRQGGAFPRTQQKLTNQEGLQLALVGDSISVGHNASGFVKAKPGQAAFGQLVADGLTKAGAKVNFLNVSRSGTTAGWGLRQLPKLSPHKADLVMIAFGMNDGRYPGGADRYAASVRKMIEQLRKENDQVEVVLVANMLPNEDFSPHSSHFANRDALAKLATEFDRVALADVMAVTEEMLKTKKFADICGNHLNHPNDFIHRLYAAVILRTIAAD